MNPYANEEMAWQRLCDIQREMENSRLIAQGGVPALGRAIRLLGTRAWWLAGLAMRRPPRPRPAATVVEAGEASAARAA